MLVFLLSMVGFGGQPCSNFLHSTVRAVQGDEGLRRPYFEGVLWRPPPKDPMILEFSYDSRENLGDLAGVDKHITYHEIQYIILCGCFCKLGGSFLWVSL